MSANAQNGPRLSRPARILCALVAVLVFLSLWWWSHGSQIRIAYGVVGALAWGSLGYYGARPGWSRYLTAVLLVAFLALALGRLAGVSWA